VTVRTSTPPENHVALHDIQSPVQPTLARVSAEMWRIVAVDSALFHGVHQHLMLVKG
jgi:hypothetical protein